jgi:threonine/homoserine/homoserine lactone efflux protein
MAPFQSAWYRLALLFFVAYLTLFWFVSGPSNPWYALMVAWATCSLEPALPAFSLIQRVPRQWLRVPAGERVLHRLFGVGIFGRLLEASGWNRFIRPLRAFSGKKAGLPSLEQHAQAGAVAHGICFAIHVLLAALALFSRYTQQVHMERRTLDAVARRSRSSLPSAAAALHDASPAASAG